MTIDDPDLGDIRMQNVVPRLNNYSGKIWRSAPKLGEDNNLVYGEWLKMGKDRLTELIAEGHI